MEVLSHDLKPLSLIRQTGEAGGLMPGFTSLSDEILSLALSPYNRGCW